MAALGPQRLFVGAVACYAVLAVELAAAIGFFLWRAWRRRRSEFWGMGGIFALAALTVAVEGGIQEGLVDLPEVHLIHFAIPLMFCALAFRLVQAFARALSTAEAARGQLEQQLYSQC